MTVHVDAFKCIDQGKFLTTKTWHVLQSSTTGLERGPGIFSVAAYLIKNKFVEEDYESVSLQSIRTLKQEKISMHKYQCKQQCIYTIHLAHLSDHPQKKVCFYITQYPGCRTTQNALHFTTLADLFIPTPTRVLWEVF